MGAESDNTADTSKREDFAGAVKTYGVCDCCGETGDLTNYAGANECVGCLRDNFAMGDANDSSEAAMWARWVFEQAE